MTPTSLVILADRGGLKAYTVTETPARGPSLRLVGDFQITGLERELPVNVEGSQHHVLLTQDWPALETETNRTDPVDAGDSRESGQVKTRDLATSQSQGDCKTPDGSRRRPRITTVRNWKSGWPNWPAALPSSMSAPLRKRK